MQANFDIALDFVWASGRDSPQDGYHVSPDDPGGGTFGGVIEATWTHAVACSTVSGQLCDADTTQLSAVLRVHFWGDICDRAPAGLDLLIFNGVMMTGMFPRLLQRCLGFTRDDVDGFIGPLTQAAMAKADPLTLINAITGVHAGYLETLNVWPIFANGWTTRLLAAQQAAGALARPPTVLVA